MNNVMLPVLALLVIALASILLVFTSDQKIMIDEAFEVAGAEKYSCVISEVDADLSLNCLKIK